MGELSNNEQIRFEDKADYENVNPGPIIFGGGDWS